MARPDVNNAYRIMAIACGLTLGGCGADGAGLSDLPEDALGTLQVVVQTGGDGVTSNGYSLKVADTPGITTGLNASVTLTVPAGPITLILRQVPVTCDPATGVRSSEGAVTVNTAAVAGESRSVMFDILCTGKDIVFTRVITGNTHEIFRMNTDGSGVVQLTSNAGPVIWYPRWSPDGTRIAYASDAVSSANLEIFVVTADGRVTTRLCCGDGATESGGPVADVDPTWSPDGNMLAWSAHSSDSSRRGIHRINVDGSGTVQLTAGWDDHPDWGPDGRILFTRQVRDPPNPGNLYVMGPSGENVTLLVERVEGRAAWSPDGEMVAFTRYDADAGTRTIWKTPAAGGQPIQRTGELWETDQRWSPDGGDFVFRYSTDRNLQSGMTGICVGPVAGTSCDRLTAHEGGSTLDVYPDWRR